MPHRPLGDWTFLVGAGVSIPSPANLPSGEIFSRKIFDLLTRTGPTFLETEAVRQLRRAVTKEIRLEIFLETLASEIPAAIVFSPFKMFRRAVPNFNHYAVATLASGVIVTTNQDLLIEEAGKRLRAPRRVIHLHGRCDDVSSIVTIISQYLGGLEPHLRRSFKGVLTGAKVVVIGYSGRDLDVMPLLVNSVAQRVKWVVHGESSISPELSHAQAVLGPRLAIIRAETSDWLKEHLDESARRRIQSLDKDVARVPLEMPDAVEESFRSLSISQRNRAIAKVLEHLGEYRRAADVYETLRRKSRPISPELLIDVGHITARVHGHGAALELYSRLINRFNLSSELQVEALLGIVDVLRNSSKPVQAVRELAKVDRLLKKRRQKQRRDKGYWRVRGWALSARGGIRRIEGRAKAADVLYARAERAFLRARDINGRIEVLTWRAESALMLGQYKLALELSDTAIRNGVAYAKYLVRGWPYYVKAEALALSGNCVDALFVVREARKTFMASRNVQGPLWSLLLEVDCLKETALNKVAGVLRRVREGLRHRQFAHVQCRLHLEEAEVARAAGDWSLVAQALAALREHLRNETMFTERPRMVIAHALLIEAECARQRGSHRAIELLRRVRAAYQRIGAKALVVRVNVALLMAGQADVSVSQLLDVCRQENYRHDLARLENAKTGFYPIHFI